MIEISYLNILGVAVLANFVAHWYTPIQPLKNRLINLFRRIPFLHNIFREVLGCSKCSGFILSIFLFFHLPVAALTSLLAYLINNLIDRVESYYE